MSFFLLSSPLGVIIGYVLTSLCTTYGSWELSFYIQTFNMLMITCVMYFYDEKYINIDDIIKQLKLQ